MGWSGLGECGKNTLHMYLSSISQKVFFFFPHWRVLPLNRKISKRPLSPSSACRINTRVLSAIFQLKQQNTKNKSKIQNKNKKTKHTHPHTHPHTKKKHTHTHKTKQNTNSYKSPSPIFSKRKKKKDKKHVLFFTWPYQFLSNLLLQQPWVIIRLKKKKTLSQSLREFFKPTRHAVFYFLFYFIFFYFNWHLPPRTSKTKNDWKVSTSVFSEIKQDFTCFLSSHVLKFFQNSKLSSFFVVKMKKKKIQEKKNESLNFAESNAHRKTNAGGSFETQNLFFLALRRGPWS